MTVFFHGKSSVRVVPEYYRNLQLVNEFGDVLVDGLPNEPPPFREINPHISVPAPLQAKAIEMFT
jgi:hypothetical protein